MNDALLGDGGGSSPRQEQLFMRVLVALGATALICAVVYFAAIGYKHLFAVWPWHSFTPSKDV